jgi:hypothetical protein
MTRTSPPLAAKWSAEQPSYTASETTLTPPHSTQQIKKEVTPTLTQSTKFTATSWSSKNCIASNLPSRALMCSVVFPPYA